MSTCMSNDDEREWEQDFGAALHSLLAKMFRDPAFCAAHTRAALLCNLGEAVHVFAKAESDALPALRDLIRIASAAGHDVAEIERLANRVDLALGVDTLHTCLTQLDHTLDSVEVSYCQLRSPMLAYAYLL